MSKFVFWFRCRKCGIQYLFGRDYRKPRKCTNELENGKICGGLLERISG